MSDLSVVVYLYGYNTPPLQNFSIVYSPPTSRGVTRGVGG